MEDLAKTTFDELFKIEENNNCFECGAPSNFWASVNNGIFLCLNCSGLHRGFGVNVSFVRSITMDSWTPLQLAMMKEGGNAKLKEFFESYQMPNDAPIDFKFQTQAAYYYREMLKAKAENKPLPEPPSPEEGLALVIPGETTGFGTSPSQETDPLDKVLNFMGKAVDATINATKQVVHDVNEKVSDPNYTLAQGASDLGSKVVSGAKLVATKVGDTVTDPNFSNNVKEVGNKVVTGAKTVVTKIGETVSDPEFQSNVKGFGNKVADKSKEIWSNRDEYVKKSSDLAMQGWNGMKGMFNKLMGNEPNIIDLKEENLTTVYYHEMPDNSELEGPSYHENPKNRQ